MKHYFISNISKTILQGHWVAACNSWFIDICRNCEASILALFTKFSNCFAEFLRTEKAAKAFSLNYFFFLDEYISHQWTLKCPVIFKRRVWIIHFKQLHMNCASVCWADLPGWLEGLTCIPGVIVTAALWTDMAQNAVAFLFICYFLNF